MEICPNCGAEVTPRMKYCGECGTKLDRGQTTASYAPAFEDGGEQAVPATELDGAALIELDKAGGRRARRITT